MPTSDDALRQRQRLGQRIAERVPGKSAEQMAAQPFGDGERGGERQDALRPAHPDQPRRGQPKPVNSARQAGKPATATGSSQPNVLASTRKA